MLVIRLARVGAKKKPVYRVVVIEKEQPRDGAFVEVVGQYNPRTQPTSIQLNSDRIQYWISKGARPSPTVQRLIKKAPAEPAPAPEVA